MDNSQLVDLILKKVTQVIAEQNIDIKSSQNIKTSCADGIAKKPVISVIDFAKDFEKMQFDGVEVFHVGEHSEKSCPDAIIYLQNLCLTAMTQIATGNCTCPKTRIVRDLFLQGKTVYTTRDQVELLSYQSTSNKAYFAMMKKQLTLLEDSGLVILNDCGGLLDIIGDKKTTKVTSDKSYTESTSSCCVNEVISKRLITEQDIISAKKSGTDTITVSAKTIVTDLARDTASRNKIKIIRNS